MQVTVTVPDALIRQAGTGGRSLVEFVEGLIARGMRAAQGRPDLEWAMAQFRAIHAPQGGGKSGIRMGEQSAD